jgi:adenine-specific DNA-methyltransferase
MAKLEDLIKQIPDAKLRAEIAREAAALKATKKFGLVFEEHIPEQVQLPNLPVKVDSRVIKRGNGKQVFQVLEIKGKTARLAPEPEGGEETAKLDELVVVKRFGEPIYPTLTPRERIERAPNKPWHTIINADNFHALQLLLYCYEGMVDVIYIDPPYNTGARDWKYNNDFVDRNDQFSHSKWLAMMKKRLLLANRLLKQDGVLIVTIDDNEVANLGVLLREMFSSSGIHLVVIEHNKRGRPQVNFAPTHEYAYFIIPSNRQVIAEQIAERDIRSINLRRTGNNSGRTNRKTMFYPIYVEPISLKIAKVGEVPDDDFHPKQNMSMKGGLVEIWPLDKDRTEKCWYYGREGLLELLQADTGKIQVQRHKGDIRLAFASDNEGKTTYKTVWSDSKFDASYYGSTLVKNVLGAEFPFPKSLYAVEECIAAVCRHRPKALVMDFFAGSGTTLNATALLNSVDEGERRCILVTNNEVSEKIAKELNEQGFFPGQSEFEKYGICESITWPRCKYVVNGKRDDGTELSGEYLNGREMKEGFEENIEYFRLDFADPSEVAIGEKFESILPILWLMAGAQGKREENKGKKAWFIPKTSPFAVLIDEHAFTEFKEAIAKRDDLTHIFLVTDSIETYQKMIVQLPETVKTKMLYKSYLDNFKINLEESL